jgi:ATP-dependent RNA helicase RhlE
MAIPFVLAGRDLMASAKTGTGKTAAFALPIIEELSKSPREAAPGKPRVLVLVPTRELAAQVGESFKAYGAESSLRCAIAFGGVGKLPQAKAIKAGAEILVATPGRLLDHSGDGTVDLGAVEVFVLDEADRMLDMGFIHDMKKVFALLPERRQTLLFSATILPAIEEIAAGILRDPERVAADPPAAPAEGVDQRMYFIEKERKRALLLHLLSNGGIDRALVFTRTRHFANRLARHLCQAGVPAEALHSDKSQGHRLRVLASFKAGELRVLVATDLAARGLDIDELSHVINMEIPNESETYVHRIGRTARAGAKGMALSFCCPDERALVKDIEKLIGRSIPVQELPADLPAAEAPKPGIRPKAAEGSEPPAGQDGQRRPGFKAERQRPKKERFSKAKAPKGEARPLNPPGTLPAASAAPGSPAAQALPGQARPGQAPREERDDRRRADPFRNRPHRERTAFERNQAPQERDGPRRGDAPRPTGAQRGYADKRERQPQRPDQRQAPRPAERSPLTDEEAWLRAQRDPRQPGIRPPEDGRRG